MKLATVALAGVLALSGPFALAHGQRHIIIGATPPRAVPAVEAAPRVERQP